MTQVVYFTLEKVSGEGVVSQRDTIGKNDLYAVVKLGHQKVQSEVAEESGVFNAGAPGMDINYLPKGWHSFKWNQEFEFNASDRDEHVEVKIYDKDVGFDDYIGKAVFNLDSARAHGRAHESAVLTDRKGEQQGKVKANIRFSGV